MQDSDDRPAPPSGAKPLADVRLDADLMNALVASDGRDNASLVELRFRHEGLVFNELRRWRVRRCDVEAVASTVWEKVWKIGRDRIWDVGRAKHVADPFVPLLRMICKRKAFDFHRQAKGQRRKAEHLIQMAEAYGEDWRQRMASRPARVPRPPSAEPAGVPPHLAAAVAALPEKLRTAFELESQGFSCRKAAERMGCAPGTASKRLSAARTRLGLPLKARPR